MTKTLWFNGPLYNYEITFEQANQRRRVHVSGLGGLAAVAQAEKALPAEWVGARLVDVQITGITKQPTGELHGDD